MKQPAFLEHRTPRSDLPHSPEDIGISCADWSSATDKDRDLAMSMPHLSASDRVLVRSRFDQVCAQVQPAGQFIPSVYPYPFSYPFSYPYAVVRSVALPTSVPLTEEGRWLSNMSLDCFDWLALPDTLRQERIRKIASNLTEIQIAELSARLTRHCVYVMSAQRTPVPVRYPYATYPAYPYYYPRVAFPWWGGWWHPMRWRPWRPAGQAQSPSIFSSGKFWWTVAALAALAGIVYFASPKPSESVRVHVRVRSRRSRR